MDFCNELSVALSKLPLNKAVNEFVLSLLIEGVRVEKPETDFSCCSSS